MFHSNLNRMAYTTAVVVSLQTLLDQQILSTSFATSMAEYLLRQLFRQGGRLVDAGYGVQRHPKNTKFLTAVATACCEDPGSVLVFISASVDGYARYRPEQSPCQAV